MKKSSKVFGYRMTEDEQEYINSVIGKYKRLTGRTTTQMIMEMVEKLDNELIHNVKGVNYEKHS